MWGTVEQVIDNKLYIVLDNNERIIIENISNLDIKENNYIKLENNKIIEVKKVQILNKQMVGSKIKISLFISVTEDITKIIEIKQEENINEFNLQN